MDNMLYKRLYTLFTHTPPIHEPHRKLIETRVKGIVDVVEEWLNDNLNTIPNRMEYYHSNEPEQMQTCGKVKAYLKLLERLK